MKLNYFSKFAVAGLSLMMALPVFAGTKPLNYVEISPIAEQDEECTVESSCEITISWNQDVKVVGDDAVVFTDGDNTIYGVTVVDPTNKAKTITTFTDLPDGLYTMSNNFAGGSIVPIDAIVSEYETLKATFSVPNYRVGLPPYDYSSVKLTSINPESMPLTETITQITTTEQKIVVNFDGAVEIEARSGYRALGSDDIVPAVFAADPDITDNSAWVFTIPADFLNTLTGNFQVLIYAKDTEGKQLTGNIEGEDNRENSYYLFTYSSYLGGKKGEIVCTNEKNADGVTYAALSDFEIVFDARLLAFDDELLSAAKLQDKLGNSYDINVATAAINGEKFTFSLTSPVEVEGTYDLSILGGVFIGAGFLSAPITASFEYKVIPPTPVVFDPVVTPAEGEVKELNKITLDFSSTGMIGVASGKATLKYNEEAPVDLPDAEYDWDNVCIVYQPLTADGSTIDKSGKYVVSFPAGYFVSGENGDVEVPAFELNYEIKGEGIENITVNKLYNVYNTLGSKVLNNATEEGVNALPAGLYIVNGKKVVIR